MQGDYVYMKISRDKYELPLAIANSAADMRGDKMNKHTEKRTETHVCDLIDRRAAIDAILAVTGNSSVRELYEHVQEHGLSDMWSGGVNAAIDIIIAVPSAPPKSRHDDIADFVVYQINWLKSHHDLEMEPVLEDAVVQMLKDTGKCYIDETEPEWRG